MIHCKTAGAMPVSVPAQQKERKNIMNKRSLFCILLALAMLFAFAACGAEAEENKENAADAAKDIVLNNEGLQLTIPAEYADLVIAEAPADELLFSVSEKASVEASQALGEPADSGAGWLFGIRRISEEELHEMLCYDMSGRELIASDGNGSYYLFCHPTDVRMVRENNEKMSEDMEQWSTLNEWAWSLQESFVAENPALHAEHFGNSSFEMNLFRLLWMPGTEYTISAPDYGTLEPGDTDASEFIHKLTEGAVYAYAANAKAPDGEYVRLTFPENGECFDFFLSGENYVRQDWSDGYEVLYKASFEDPAVKASDVAYEWYRAIAEHTGGTNSYTPDDLLGRWAEKIAGRCLIEITRGASEGEYAVHIHWGSSAFESANWDMTAYAEGNGGQLRYENARCYIRTYSSETEYTDTVEYENGTGTFVLNSAYEIMWDDETAHAAENCVFVNVDIPVD